MIRRLSLTNYRAFERIDIPLTKINLLFGPNNSGKSALLSAINLLSQTLDSGDRDVPLLLTGKFEDLGTYKDIVYGNDTGRDIAFGLEFDMRRAADEEVPRQARIDITFHYRKQRREIVLSSTELSAPPGEVLLKTRVAKVSKSQLVERVGPKFSGIKMGTSSSGTITLNHYVPSFMPSLGRRWFPRTSRRYSPYREIDFILYLIAGSLTEHLGSVEYIGPFRSQPQRTYTFSGETPSSVGVRGEKAVDILAADESRRGSKKHNIAQMISRWLQKSKIAEAIRILSLTDRYFEIKLTHFETGEFENLADVGYGCSQILPILVAGYYLPTGSVLIVEQPEIHLHPRAEAEVGTFLCEVAKRGVQLLIETHSEHLLLRLQSHVASGDLSPEDVNVFYLYSDTEAEKKQCKRIPLGTDGFFKEEWPKGFFPERLQEAKRLARFSI